MLPTLFRLHRYLFLSLALLAGGCAATQMRQNVMSYDDALAVSANEMLLLNAVRSSQRYPMSFASVGQIYGAPQLAGSLGGQMNFTDAVGFTTATLTPSVSTIGPGYSQFTLDNLNSKEFMDRMRRPVDRDIIKSFLDSNWPKELVRLVYVQSLNPDAAKVEAMDRKRRSACAAPRDERASRLCAVLDEDTAAYGARCSGHFSSTQARLQAFRDDPDSYYNSVASACHFLRFQIVLREARLLQIEPCPPEKPGPGCLRAKYRSALQMVQYLGDLIAAQHYIEAPFVPTVLIGHSTIEGSYEFVRAPLFEVRRDPAGLALAAVRVRHADGLYYIPRPDFGAPAEARSLQALDLVLQSIRAATFKTDLPKGATPVNLVGGK
jgi:hypothetical protein